VKSIAPDEIQGTYAWTRTITVSALLVALLSPFLGALADQGGYRKRFLFFTTVLAVIGSAMLYPILPGEVTLALVWVLISNVAFELGMVFYNAFLPDIAPADRIGRISGYGWALGYAGGLMAMFIALFGFIQPEVPWFGFSKELGENIRATNLLVACWYTLFSIPLFLFIKEDRSKINSVEKKKIRATFLELKETFLELRRYRQVVKFLIARLVYNDALITIFALGGIYASGTFHFTLEEILVFGIVLNVTAGICAFALGFLDDLLGGKKTIQISLIALILATLIAMLAPSKALFWIAGILVGIFSGPNQAASRSLMGRFVPKDKTNEFFGFFAFSGKFTAFLGPFLFGEITKAFESQRLGLAVVLVLFVIGSILLILVDEKEGIRLAQR
jgi:UMF1 family MFS transporter